MSRPRLLFISPRFLFPLDEGGKIRTVGILRGMRAAGRFDITLASPAPRNLSPHKEALRGVADRFVSWAAPNPGRVGKALAVLGRLPVSTLADRSAAGRAVVSDQLAVAPDVIVADFPHSAVLLPARLPAPGVMFTHNVEAEILERHAAQATGWRQRVWRREARKMAHFEAEILRRFARVVAVSARDAEALAQRYDLAGVERIDTGVDLDFYPFVPPGPQAETVVFSGAMDSRSNIDGVSFLLREVWPHVAASRPDLRMLVVGRNPPAALVAEAQAAFGGAWQFTGFVDDIRPALRRGQISVIPLRVGSGTRLKAFEAIALGLPVVSTTLGVEGLGLEPGRHYLAADDAAAFAGRILALAGDAPLREILAQEGRALLEARYGWPVIAAQFEAICRAALG